MYIYIYIYMYVCMCVYVYIIALNRVATRVLAFFNEFVFRNSEKLCRI